MLPRNFYLDIQSRQFVASPNVAAPAVAPVFFGEDVEEIALYFLEPTPEGSTAYRYVNYSGNTVKLAVGVTAPAALQTSWTATTTTITAAITTLTNGGSGSNEVQKLTLTGGLPAEGGMSLTIPSRGVTVSSVSSGLFTAGNHGLINGQSVTLSGFSITASSFANSTYFVVGRTKDTFRISNAADGASINAQVTSGGGTATLPAITTPVLTQLTAQNLQQAFIDAGIGSLGQPQIIVTGSYSQGFNFNFANTQANIDFGAMTVSSTLAAAAGLKANVSFNTNEIAALIAAGTTSNLRLEVEVSDGTKRQTYATSCNISDDIITTSSPVPVPPGGSPVSTLSFSDGSGGTWQLSVDASGVVTTSKL
jgi:hypothetical protein